MVGHLEEIVKLICAYQSFLDAYRYRELSRSKSAGHDPLLDRDSKCFPETVPFLR